MTLYNLGCLLYERGAVDRAIPQLSRSIKLARQLVQEGEFQKTTLHFMLRTVGILYMDNDDLQRAGPLLIEVEELSKELLGPEHVEHGRDMLNLAHLLVKRGDGLPPRRKTRLLEALTTRVEGPGRKT